MIKLFLTLVRPALFLQHILIYFVQLIVYSMIQEVRDPRAEAVGEQGDYYDPLFTYKEGDEASYFVVSKDSGGDAIDVGPVGVGPQKEVPWPPAL